MRSFVAALDLLALLCISHAYAVALPAAEGCSLLRPAATTPWTRFSAYLLELIRGQQPITDSQTCEHDNDFVARLPSDVVARYGGELVVRFAFSSPEQASALADTANGLNLDVWDSTEEWVDIRIATDVVCPFGTRP
jgi:hypothetical protein